jgi:hypothetical protein
VPSQFWQLFLVDVGVVDAVDVEVAQVAVVDVRLGLVVLEAQRLEEIHVDDRGAGGDDHVDHPVLQHVAVDVHAAAGRGGAGERQPGRAVGVLQAHRPDVGGARGVAAGEAHLAHGVDDRPGVVLVDRHVLDGVGQQLGLAVGLLNVSVHLRKFPSEGDRPSIERRDRDGATGRAYNI